MPLITAVGLFKFCKMDRKKNLDIPTKVRLSKEEQKLAVLKNHLANEKIHNLVVKVISWKFGILEGASISEENKVTKKEWNEYKRHILNISKIEDVEKVENKLKDVHNSIKLHGGFE